ncbi:glycosyltransferase family 2 protein [Candidatus Lokiarchaeum ossiferum]|uniref:glycosyltransferase family 2 protein n=1 Tax=Candidatus Lokiarchaeum ossiferum TaxID=2951803 RepID=UPI00352FA387
MGTSITLQSTIITQESIPNYSTAVKKRTNCPKIHIIVPAYNESKAIVDIIHRIQKVMNPLFDYHITVIDDGSSDNTVSILQEAHLDIELLKNSVNLGKGKTLLRGFQLAAKNEIVLVIDGDGEHPPEDIPKLLQPIIEKRAEVVIGSRFLQLNKVSGKKGSYLKNRKQFSYFRRIGNILISILIFLFHQTYITDSQCGFRAFAPGIAPLYKPKYSGFEVETEMTIFFIKKRIRIIEIPMDTGLSTRESHMSIIKDSFKIFLVIVDMLFKKERQSQLFHRLFPSFFINPLISVKKSDFEAQAISRKKRIKSIIQNSEDIKVSFVIPCYNESETLLEVVRKIHEINLNKYEIIIVDDGSLDKPLQYFTPKDKKNVRNYYHRNNLGYGKTLLDGIGKCSGDYICTIDSDGQHDPRDIYDLIYPIYKKEADIVIGSRYSGQYYYDVPLLTRVGESFIEFILKYLFGQEIKNNQAGFRVFHRRTLGLFTGIKFFDMAFTTEILMNASVKGFKIKEQPIHLYGRSIGNSRVKKIPLLMDVLHSTVYYLPLYLKKKYGLARKNV